MSKLDWDNIAQATDEELAEAILSKQGDRPIEVYFMRSAAVELAKRISPNAKVGAIHGTNGNKSQGEARPRNTRMQKAVIEDWRER